MKKLPTDAKPRGLCRTESDGLQSVTFYLRNISPKADYMLAFCLAFNVTPNSDLPIKFSARTEKVSGHGWSTIRLGRSNR